MIQFSVVIPTLHSPIINQTLLSLENQTFDHNHYRVTVVGMDKHNLVYENDLIRFDRSDHPLSSAQARNRGAAGSQSEIIAFLDADCIALPDWLATLAERFQDPHTTVVGGGVTFATTNYWTLADNVAMFYTNLATQPPGERQILPSLNLAIRRGVFEQLHGFDERYPRAAGEDSDLCIRLRQQGHRLYFEPRAVVRHSPSRHRPQDLLRHGYYQGKYSPKVDPRHARTEGFPAPLRHPLSLILLSPLLATAATLRVFAGYPDSRPYWYTAPAIYLVKLAWCFGAARRPLWQ